ncbi:hypothetical protein ACSLGG_29690 (plasmid) [Bacillus mycoides]|uniref:hypothetical protein n=1 Tax=Bacillus mycoides TaxID=1405 RepID=UPI003F74CE42
MKNHIKVNGKLLQTNKKWSHLRQKQKDNISNWLGREYIQFVRTHHRKPIKYEHDEILHEVMNQIQEREIWIPYGEVKKYYVGVAPHAHQPKLLNPPKMEILCFYSIKVYFSPIWDD